MRRARWSDLAAAERNGRETGAGKRRDITHQLVITDSEHEAQD